jgi:hypothetical protein
MFLATVNRSGEVKYVRNMGVAFMAIIMSQLPISKWHELIGEATYADKLLVG